MECNAYTTMQRIQCIDCSAMLLYTAMNVINIAQSILCNVLIAMHIIQYIQPMHLIQCKDCSAFYTI